MPVNSGRDWSGLLLCGVMMDRLLLVAEAVKMQTCGLFLPVVASDTATIYALRVLRVVVYMPLRPPPPFICDPKYIHNPPKIRSYAAVSSGSHICISVEGAD